MGVRFGGVVCFFIVLIPLILKICLPSLYFNAVFIFISVSSYSSLYFPTVCVSCLILALTNLPSHKHVLNLKYRDENPSV